MGAPFSPKVIQRTANTPFNDKTVVLGVAKFSLSDMKDGASNTVVFSESLTAANWNSPYPSFHAGVTPASTQQSTVFVWLYGTDGVGPHQNNPMMRPPTVIPASPLLPHMRVNGDVAGVTPGHAAELWRPSSQHSGGVIMAFADGSTKFVKNEITYDVYQSLMTPDGSKSDMPANYIPSAGDIE